MEDFLPHLTHMTGRQRRTSVHFYDTGELPPRISNKDSLAENDDVPLENSVDLEVPGRASKDHQGSTKDHQDKQISTSDFRLRKITTLNNDR